MAMYTDYLFQFEVAAVILLVAIIAAIALTMRRRPDTKYQTPSEQVQIKKADRLRVVTMNSTDNQDVVGASQPPASKGTPGGATEQGASS